MPATMKANVLFLFFQTLFLDEDASVQRIVLKSMRNLLFACLMCFFATMSNAQTFEYDGLLYTVRSESEKTVKVARQNRSSISGDITIPSSVLYDGESYCVNAIDNYAFNYCSNLRSIEIPNTVTIIGGVAFYECERLRSVTIPNSVTTIGAYAFDACRYLEAIDLPNSVTSIGKWAFANCQNIKTVNIPNSLTIINDYLFASCIELTTVTIPNSVTEIGNNAFSGCKLESISIPNSVTTIGEGAFSRCNFTSFNLPNSVENIKGNFLGGCENLTSLSVDSDNPKYDSRNNSNCIIESSTNTLVLGCKNSTIPNTVASIGYLAFDGLSELTSIIIPNSVSYIDCDAFYYCGITSVTIPESVTKIEYMAFNGCDNLTEIKVEDGNPVYDSRDNCNCIIESLTNKVLMGCKTSTIPNSVVVIGQRAFNNCHELTSIIIPNSVKVIEEGAFSGCSLSSLTMSNSVEQIGNNAFTGNSFASLELPNTLTEIGFRAFMSCSLLTSVTIPQSVVKIGSQAFDYSPWFENFKNNPENVYGNILYINDIAYSAASQDITECSFRENTISLSGGAFDECYALNSISIPNTIKTIEPYTFTSCEALKKVSIGNGLT